jgi:hypothetical protein
MRATRLRVVIPVALVALLGVFALVGALVRSGGQGGRELATSASDRTSMGTSSAAGDAVPGAAQEEAAKAADGSAQTAGEAWADLPPEASPASHYLIRNGSITLTVARHGLRDVMQRIGSVTLGMGGYVLSSYIGSETPWVGPVEPMAYDTDQSAQGVPPDVADGSDAVKSTDGSGDVVQYGTITVRVPGAKFDDAVRRFSALGDVVDLTTSADDVSDQMVDLRARLAHARAVDRRLVGFLDQARTIKDTLAIQDRIDANQLTIEQLTAQLAQMNEVTSYGTITVTMHERGVPQPGAIDESDSFWGAFTNSIGLIADGATASAVALGALLPFLVLIGGVAVAVWYTRRAILRRRPPRTPEAPLSQG